MRKQSNESNVDPRPVSGALVAAAITALGLGAYAPDSKAATLPVGVNGCTLGDAIIAANTNAAQGTCPAGDPGEDVIVLQPGSIHELTEVVDEPNVPGSPVSAFAAVGPSGTPYILETLVIEGNGATIRRAEGAPTFRLLTISTVRNSSSPGREGKVILNDLNLENGRNDGAGGCDTDAGGGGAIYAELQAGDDLLINRSTLSGNRAGSDGGAIELRSCSGVTGRLIITDSALINNSAIHHGGAIAARGGGAIHIARSTLSGNSLSFSGEGVFSAIGGAVFSDNSLTISDSTITGNSNPSGFVAAVAAAGPLLELNRTLVADNVSAEGGQVFGFGEYQGAYNAFGAAGNANQLAEYLGFPNAVALGDTDIVPSQALEQILAPLADNGGPTPTRALLTGNPAIDAIPASDCGADNVVDQRGMPRPVGAGCDIGAFEAGLFETAVSAEPLLLVQTGGLLNLQLRGQAQATLVDVVNQAPIAGQTIAFTANSGPSLCSAVTDDDGVARCNATTGLSVILGGGYSARFADSGQYLGSSDSAGIVETTP